MTASFLAEQAALVAEQAAGRADCLAQLRDTLTGKVSPDRVAFVTAQLGQAIDRHGVFASARLRPEDAAGFYADTIHGLLLELASALVAQHAAESDAE